jgi:KUP system potassium uptake protein
LPAVIGATGIVYGDIGTSPLYAFEESLKAAGGSNAETILGVLSLIFWALALSVTLKYIVIMMKADNEGEGGVLALFALAQRRLHGGGRWPRTVLNLALAGTALFFCDALITPAISVLSAVEGMELVNPHLERAIIPVTLGVLAVLFLIQRHGTDRVAKLFGPIMILWFAVLGVSGAVAIVNNPLVLQAINPVHGVALLVNHPALALAIIGAVFLALTGGEALYADMGHFGKAPVRMAWFAVVWPGLVLNYFGQGALLLGSAVEIKHPLYALVPPSFVPGMVFLATAATVIASQAVISGAFSVARQAMQLDLLPRMKVLQTCAHEQGQIYVPVVNALIFVSVVAFVLGFGSSSALAGAYGAAVVGTMFITTVLGAYVAVALWGWAHWRVAIVFAPMLLMDCVFIAGNLTKIEAGGWVPLSLGALLFAVFSAWYDGRIRLRAALAKLAIPRKEIVDLLDGVPRVAGIGVYLASDADIVPSALIRNLEHNKVAHETVVILNIEIARTPRVSPRDRVKTSEDIPGVHCVTAYFGFMETPDVREALKSCRTRGLKVYLEECSFFIGQHVVLTRRLPGWQGLKLRLFARMQRRSNHAAEFFRMPVRRVVSLNTAVEI